MSDSSLYRVIKLAKGRAALITLVIVLLIASFLRFYGLEVQSLSNDELSSWRQSSHENLSDVIQKGVRPDVHPPGFQIMLYFVERIFGDSAPALRFPSVIFGILSVVAIYLIGLRLFSKGEALISAALLAVLRFPVFYSQDARSYSMMLLFTLVSSYFLISVIEELREDCKAHIPTAIKYIASATVLAYSHYFGLYMVVLQGVFTAALFILKPRKLIHVLALFGITALMYVPWLPVLREHLSSGPIWIMPPARSFIRELHMYLQFICNKSRIMKTGFVTICVLLLIHMYSDIIHEPTKKNIKNILLSKETVLFLWLIVPFAGAYILSKVSTPVLTERNMIIILPAACLLIGRSLMRIPVKHYIRGIIVSAGILYLIYYLIVPLQYYKRPVKCQFREAVRFVLNSEHIDDSALIVANSNYAEYFDYYFEKSGSDRRVDINFMNTGDWPKVESALTKNSIDYIFYICAGRKDTGQLNRLGKLNDYKRKTHMKLVNGYAALYAKRDEPAARESKPAFGSESGKPTSPMNYWIQGRNAQDPNKKIEYFEKLLEEFPEHELAPRALYMIGFVHAEMLKDSVTAIAIFRELIDKYPSSDLAETAKWSIENINKPPPTFTDTEAGKKDSKR